MSQAPESHPQQQLQLVSLLPSGAPAQEASLGNEDKDVRNAVSADGSRVFWTGLAENAKGESFQHLFMRDTASEKTVEVDAAQGVAEQPEEDPNSKAKRRSSRRPAQRRKGLLHLPLRA